MDLNLIALKNIKVLANFNDDTHFLNCDGGTPIKTIKQV